ncbi:hypothetical protein BDM02DRAFT_19482 [Thelephora ganbajun]|uniref:Uncharacterized protein n=1 Tax=Thelephora ganbajun TaxID=370292 RepID=A0ACB6ZXL2_THEGA|nr:hypothetical protein BDM02DRAFT_19482 [Thelephora ganbajun]
MSSPTQFKFSKDGVIRRVAFAQLPSWLEIVAKLESLYNIPIDHLAVSYTDGDGDEVTLSSQEELEDYYRADSDPLLRRLSVVDLSVIRSFEEKSLPDTPSISHRLRETPSHNTFGTIPFHQDTVEDDWQRIPGFNPFYSGEISSGSGNEVQFAQIGGDSSIRSGMTGDTPATHSRASTPTLGNKGKAHEYGNTSSTDSVLANDTPEKPPVHVYQVSGHGFPLSSDITADNQEVPPSSSHDAPDPPLAEFDPPSTQPTPTLTSDVAAFLGMISIMFAQNPQLTDALRGIMQNIGNGTYWAAHRDQLSRAAEEVRRSASDIQAHFNVPANGSAFAETRAAQQIAEAIGNIVRSFTQNAPRQEGDHGEHIPGSWPNIPPPRGPFPPGPPPHHGPFPPFPPHPPMPPLHAGFPFRGRGFFGFGRGGWGAGRGGPFHWGPQGRHGHQGPGGHRHHGPEGPESHRHRDRRSEKEDSHSDSSGESVDDAEADISLYGISQKISPEERKARLLAAKAEYKAQKTLYRAEKQAKRMERQRSSTADLDAAEAAAKVASVNVDINAAAGPASQTDALLISQGRGLFPSLEMVSVPRRHNTISGGTIRGSRHDRDASGSTDQTATIEVRRARVVRKLSDMGFEGSKVENRVSVHIPDVQTLEEKGEDAIVAKVVEDLLQPEGGDANKIPNTPGAN